MLYKSVAGAKRKLVSAVGGCDRISLFTCYFLAMMPVALLLSTVYLAKQPGCRHSPAPTARYKDPGCPLTTVGALCLGDFTDATLSSETGDPETTCKDYGYRFYAPVNATARTRKWIGRAFNTTTVYAKRGDTYAAFNLTSGKFECYPEVDGTENCNVYGDSLVLCLRSYCGQGQEHRDMMCVKDLGYAANVNDSFVGCSLAGMRLPYPGETMLLNVTAWINPIGTRMGDKCLHYAPHTGLTSKNCRKHEETVCVKPPKEI